MSPRIFGYVAMGYSSNPLLFVEWQVTPPQGWAARSLT